MGDRAGRQRPPIPVQIATLDQTRGVLGFAAPLDQPLSVAPGLSIQTPDNRLQLPILAWQMETGDDGSERIIGAHVRGFVKGDRVSLVHAEDRGRIQYPLIVCDVTGGAALQRVFVPASYLIYSGSHVIEVSLENDNGDPTA
jgi:hypothetical protein